MSTIEEICEKWLIRAYCEGQTAARWEEYAAHQSPRLKWPKQMAAELAAASELTPAGKKLLAACTHSKGVLESIASVLTDLTCDYEGRFIQAAIATGEAKKLAIAIAEAEKQP